MIIIGGCIALAAWIGVLAVTLPPYLPFGRLARRLGGL